MKYLNGIDIAKLAGQTIKSVKSFKSGSLSDLMPKINHYNAYTFVTEKDGVQRTFVIWNSMGETNCSEVLD